MWSKRTFDASGFAEAQENGVEPAHSNPTCPNSTSSNLACSSRVRITGTSRHAHN